MNLLSPRQVAGVLGIHVQTVYRNKALPGRVKIGRLTRFKAREIENYVDSRTIPCRNLPPKHDIIVLGGGESMPKGKHKAYYSFGYGAILVRRRKDGTLRFYLDYREDGQRQREIIPRAATLEDAVNALKQKLAIYGRKTQSFSSWADRYLDSHIKPHLKKPRTEELRLENLKTWFKVDDLRRITPTMVDEFRAWRLREGNTRATVNRYVALLKTMLNRALDEGYLEHNPCKKVKQYSERNQDHIRILSEDEEVRLYAELADHIKPIVTIALNTGLRLGEIMKLKWSDVDLTKNLLKVENTKAGKVRYVPISNQSSHVFATLARARVSQRAGSLFAIRNPKTGFKAACRRAGILGLRFHDLRHTFASRLLSACENIETTRQLLGHSSLSVTQKYVHSGIDQARKAVESLPNLSHPCHIEKSNNLDMASKLVN